MVLAPILLSESILAQGASDLGRRRWKATASRVLLRALSNVGGVSDVTSDVDDDEYVSVVEEHADGRASIRSAS